MNNNSEKIIQRLLETAPELEFCVGDIRNAVALITKCYNDDGKTMICGNGGSAADAEHIVGELMKGFVLKRSVNELHNQLLKKNFPEDADYISAHLQGALPAISLVSQSSFSSAFSNDVSSEMVFAQQVYGYGKKGDVLIGLSTSGNSKNILYATKVAKTFGVKTICFTGRDGGLMKDICDVSIRVPADETYRVQEYHLMTYHCVCAIIEAEFFTE